MKKDIKKLEIKKLFKEFGFLKIDEEYKIEIQALYGPEFEKKIQDVFKENPDMNLIFNNNQNINGNSNTNTSAGQTNSESSAAENLHKFIGIEIYDPNNINISNEIWMELYTGKTQATEPIKEGLIIDEKVKKLYRKIATKTHPDKVSSKHLHELYLKAQEAHNKNDIFTLYLISNDLNIEYEFEVSKLSDFKNKIRELKNKNSLIEQTYLWAWIHEENEEIKKHILHHFITHAYKRRA